MFTWLRESFFPVDTESSTSRPSATRPTITVLDEDPPADSSTADDFSTFDPLVDGSSSILFLFPADIVLSVFYEWLTSRDISALDIAMCSKLQRRAYLQLLSSPFPSSKWVFRRSFDNCEMLTWLSKRKVAMYQLKLFAIGSHRDFDHFSLFCRSLRVLDFCGLSKLTDQHVAQLLGVCAHSLTHVTINHCQSITMDSVTRLVSSCGSLIHLELVELAFHLGTLPPELPRQLPVQSLVLKRALVFTVEKNSAPFHSLFRAFPELQKASISLRCNSDPWVQDLSRTCPKLRRLDLGSISVNVDNFFELLAASLPLLSELSVHNLNRAREQTGASLLAIGNFQQLERLVFGSERVTDNIVHPLCQSSGHFVREVRLLRAKHITNRSLHALAMACAQLEVLECQTAAITDAGVHDVLVHCPRLRSVSFPYCDQLNSGTFVSLAEHGAALEEIDVFQVRYDHASHVLNVLASCPRLRKFVLSDWVGGMRDEAQRILSERLSAIPSLGKVLDPPPEENF